MKTELVKNDYCYFLYAQHLVKGIVVRVNRSTITVKSPASACQQEIVKRVAPDRVAHFLDEFTVVWEMDIGVEERYYITYDEFPKENKPGSQWHQPYTYVTK